MRRTLLFIVTGGTLLAAGYVVGVRQTPPAIQPAPAPPPQIVVTPWDDPADIPPMFQLDPVEPITLEPPKLTRAQVALEEIEARLSKPQPSEPPTHLVDSEQRFARPVTPIEKEDDVGVGLIWSLDKKDGKMKVEKNTVGGVIKALKKKQEDEE